MFRLAPSFMRQRIREFTVGLLAEIATFRNPAILKNEDVYHRHQNF